MRRFLILLAVLIGLGLTAVPAQASVPTHVDMRQRRIDYGSMDVNVAWHIGYTTMKACEVAVTSRRSETHDVRVEVYRPSNGTVYFSTIIQNIAPGETAGTVGHVMDLEAIGSSGLAARAKWGDSPVWHIVKSDRSQSEVENFIYTFGAFDWCV